MKELTIEQALRDMPVASTISELVKQYLEVCDLPEYYTEKPVLFESTTGKPVRYERVEVYADYLLYGKHFINTLKMTDALFTLIYDSKFQVIETESGIKIHVKRASDGSDYGTSIQLSNLKTAFVEGF